MERAGPGGGWATVGRQLSAATRLTIDLNDRLGVRAIDCSGLRLLKAAGKMVDTMVGLRDRGVAVLLVEQKVEVALAVADRIAFLDNGTIAETARRTIGDERA